MTQRPNRSKPAATNRRWPDFIVVPKKRDDNPSVTETSFKDFNAPLEEQGDREKQDDRVN